jgi:hypothetical protein
MILFFFDSLVFPCLLYYPKTYGSSHMAFGLPRSPPRAALPGPSTAGPHPLQFPRFVALCVCFLFDVAPNSNIVVVEISASDDTIYLFLMV